MAVVQITQKSGALSTICYRGGNNMWTITAERELETMPFDKMFEVAEGRQELCHATGKEVCFGNPNVPADWWNEYQDSDGDYWYGR